MVLELFKCKKCDTKKPLSPEYFHKNKNMKTGYSQYCKECENKRKREYRKENKKELDKKYAQRVKELEKSRNDGLIKFDKLKQCSKCKKVFKKQ